jgi:NitT/TauT family transport system permease protein
MPTPIAIATPTIATPARADLPPSTFWSIRQGIPRWLKFSNQVIGFAIPLLIWMILS